MAEELRGSVTGGNGERLQFQIGSKSFGIQARDLIPVLLLLLIALGGYLLYTSVDHDLDLLYVRQQSILDQLHAMDEQRILQTIRLHKLLEVHDYNAGRPHEERMPLTLDPPLPAKPQGAK